MSSAVARRPKATGRRPKMIRTLALGLWPMAFTVLLSACRQDMHDAPRYDPLEYSPVFAKGSSALPLVEGTVARGFLHEDALLYQGKVNGQPAMAFPFPITRSDMD